jgi:hypothetical protein
MTKHKITIQIEDVEGVEISIKAACEPEFDPKGGVTPALACASAVLQFLKEQTQGPCEAPPVVDAEVVANAPVVASEEAEILSDPAAVAAIEKAKAGEGVHHNLAAIETEGTS